MSVFDWTTGGDPELSHQRSIGSGSGGDVHQMYNNSNSQSFARKLIRPIGSVTMDDIFNEGRALHKLCSKGSHENIITVIEYGRLPQSPYYFFDMELCEFNLDDYIQERAVPRLFSNNPSRSREAMLSSEFRIWNLWNIMEQVSKGVEFIHINNEVHRDLKPSNSTIPLFKIFRSLRVVLYSSKANLWKIADFGYTTEGTSRHGRPTLTARGTECYRAPELLTHDAIYNNKVDIWALGCILCKLATRETPFKNDYQLIQFVISQGTVEIPALEHENRWTFRPTELIIEMLRIEPCSRPPATILRRKFETILEECPVPDILRGLRHRQSGNSEFGSSSSRCKFCSMDNMQHNCPDLPEADVLTPDMSTRRSIPYIVPLQIKDIDVGTRICWILESGMDIVLSSLHPEHRLLAKGAVDFRQLLVPLLQEWEVFRLIDRNRNAAEESAKKTHQLLQQSFPNNNEFEKFWGKKLDPQNDEIAWNKFKATVIGLLEQLFAVDKILDAAKETYDAYELLLEIFEKTYLYFCRMNESSSAGLTTSSMWDIYALVVIDLCKIVRLAARYAPLGTQFYWRTMFDPNDELYKLVARFNCRAVQEIDNQIAQITYLLEKYHKETDSAIQGLSQEVGMLRQETLEHSRGTNDLLKRLVVDSPRTILTCRQEITMLEEWLKVPQATEDDFSNFKMRKMRDTCEWIFEDPRFQSWKTSSDPISALLWIHAPAGRGKSVLAATTIQHLQHLTRNTKNMCVYFFCRSDDEAKKTPHAILRSTACRLAQISDTIRRQLVKFVNNYPNLRVEELPLASLWDRLFIQCICDQPPDDTVPFRIYWVIDALDECVSTSRSAFTKMLTELSEPHCGVRFRVLFLSRYISDIAKVAGTAMIPTIEIKTSVNENDIQQFINVNVRTSSLGCLSEENRVHLVTTLKDRANGSFLWIKLVMEELEGRRSMRSIEKVLNIIPANRSLEDVYQRTLDSLASSCDQEDLDLAREIFAWTLCAPRHLTLIELTTALEASLDTTMMDVERAVKETCGSLIEVVDVQSEKCVIAVHMTLREFMLSEKSTGCLAFSKAQAHADLAKVCLNYLLHPIFAKPFTKEIDGKMDPSDVAAEHRLLKYASRYWSFHLVSSLDIFDSDMNALLLQFLQSRNVLTCIEAVATFGSLTPLSRFSDDLCTWLDRVTARTKEVNQQATVPTNVIARWALDFRRLKQRFHHSLVRYPKSIHDSLPSFSPTKSMVFQLGGAHANISIVHPSTQIAEWGNFINIFRIPGFVRTMICSPKGSLIVSADDSPVIQVWEAETGQAIRELKGHKDLVYSLAYSEDEKYLASAGKDGSIIVWNVERGHEMFQLRGHSGGIHTLTYSCSGKYVASGGEDSTVRVWHVSEVGGREMHVLTGHMGTVYNLKYRLDDVQLCSSAEDGWVTVWNAIYGVRLRRINTNLKWMGRLSFHPSGDYILTSSERESANVEIWNIETSKVINRIVTTSPVRCWRYTPSGKLIVTGHLDGKIRIWDAASMELLHILHEDAWSLRFGLSGKYLNCVIRDNARWQVRTWNFEKEMNEISQQRKLGHPNQTQSQRVIQALTVNMNNSRLATVTLPYMGTWKGTVKLWDTIAAEVIWEQEQNFRNQDCVSPGFSPDGRYLVCYDSKEGGMITVVDASAAKVVERISISSFNVVSLALDVDASGLAIATREMDIFEDTYNPSVPCFFLSRRLDIYHGPLDIVKTLGTQNSMTLSYTADGMKLLLATRDRQDYLYITIWETDSQQLVRQVVYHQERYIWFKMFGGFRLLSEDRIVIHLDYMPLDAISRSHWHERMLVLTPDGEEVQRFEAGSSRMTISYNRVIFLDSEYWIVSWDGHGQPKRHVKLPFDVGFAISGLSFCEGKLTLISRTEGITVVEIESLK